MIKINKKTVDAILTSIKKQDKKSYKEFNLSFQEFGEYLKFIKTQKLAYDIFLREFEEVFTIASINDAYISQQGNIYLSQFFE